jgi:hypothetical protein
MKTLTLILTVCFLSLGFSSYAQAKTNPTDTHQYPKPVVTKGYYSIGNNAEKLSMQSASRPEVTTTESYPAKQKGYYSIGDNKKKLKKQLIAERTGKRSAPVVTKGYYSIGRNNEKLK